MNPNMQRDNGPYSEESQSVPSKRTSTKRNQQYPPEAAVQSPKRGIFSLRRDRPSRSEPSRPEVMQAYRNRGCSTQQLTSNPYGQAQNTRLKNQASDDDSYPRDDSDERPEEQNLFDEKHVEYTSSTDYDLGKSIFERKVEQPFTEEHTSDDSGDQEHFFPPEFRAENDAKLSVGNNALDLFVHDSDETHVSLGAQDEQSGVESQDHTEKPRDSHEEDEEMEDVEGEEDHIQFVQLPPTVQQQGSARSTLRHGSQTQHQTHQVQMTRQQVSAGTSTPVQKGSEYDRARDPRVAARSGQNVTPQSVPVPVSGKTRARSQQSSRQQTRNPAGPQIQGNNRGPLKEKDHPVGPRQVPITRIPGSTASQDGRTAAGHPQAEHQLSQMWESVMEFTDAQLRVFKPEGLDHQIRKWREQGLSWDDVSTMLAVSKRPVPNMLQVRLRQQMMDAKTTLEARDAGIVLAPSRATVIGANQTPQQLKTIQPSQQARTARAQQASQSTTLTALNSANSKGEDAMTMAVLREREKIAWQEERNELLERLRVSELELLEAKDKSNRLQNELNEARFVLNSQTQIEDQLAREKEASSNLHKRLKEEQLLRGKAERTWREHQQAEHRKLLAEAATTRGVAKATPAGFAFDDNETFGDDDEEQDGKPKEGPTRRKRSQSDVQVHPSEGGKFISQAMIQKYLRHLEKGQNEPAADSVLDSAVPEILQEQDLTYYVYSVKRKQWPRDFEEPDSDGVVCSQHTYLNQANASVQSEVLRPWGGAGIGIEPDKDFTLHGNRDELGMAWSQIDVPTGHVKVWVERELHTAYEGALPLFEATGFVSKIVYSVKQESRRANNNGVNDGNVADVVEQANTNDVVAIEESEELYTTFDLANKKASEKVFNLVWGDTSSRYADVMRKTEAADSRRVFLEDLEDKKDLFSEDVEKDGRKVKIFVVKKTLVGPRN